MNRTVRLVSLLRWTAVAMHTALVFSVYASVSTVPRNEGMWTQYIAALLLLIDLPASLLTLLSVFLLDTKFGAWCPVVFVLLGGLQWYLMASLLARWTCGFQEAMSLASKRFGTAMILCLFLVGGCGIMPWTAHLVLHPRPYTLSTATFSGDSRDLRQSAVVPALDTPMPKDKNVVGCGTLQLAWNRLGKDVLHELPNVQAAEAIVSRLNRTQFKEDDLPPGSYLATAGFAKDGVVEKVKAEMKQRFHKEVEIEAMKPNDILAYAYLEASAAFTIPFFDNRERFHFRESSGKDTEVTSFGIEEKHEYAYDELREQIDVLYWLRNEHEPEPVEFVVDLCRDSKPNQIVVACVPPRATLAETLDDVEKKTQEFARQHQEKYGRKFGVRDVLLVPNLNWEVRHHFAELEGTDKRLLNTGFTGYHIAEAMQTIRFKLDRSGAELASEAQVFCLPIPTHFVFNRPFLIVVKKRGAERPFFVMWVDNAELLSKP
jgi:hypothetical protein